METPTMLETVMSYVGQLTTQLGSTLSNTTLQPFILIPTAIGVLGAIIGLARRVAKVGSGRRR